MWRYALVALVLVASGCKPSGPETVAVTPKKSAPVKLIELKVPAGGKEVKQVQLGSLYQPRNVVNGLLLVHTNSQVQLLDLETLKVQSEFSVPMPIESARIAESGDAIWILCENKTLILKRKDVDKWVDSDAILITDGGVARGIQEWVPGETMIMMAGGDNYPRVRVKNGKIVEMAPIQRYPSTSAERYAMGKRDTKAGPRLVELSTSVDGTVLEYYDPVKKKRQVVLKSPLQIVAAGVPFDETSGMLLGQDGIVRVISKGSTKEVFKYETLNEQVTARGFKDKVLMSGRGHHLLVDRGGLCGRWDAGPNSMATMLPDGRLCVIDNGLLRLIEFPKRPARGFAPLAKSAPTSIQLELGQKIDPKKLTILFEGGQFWNTTSSSAEYRTTFRVFNENALPAKWARIRFSVWAPGMKKISKDFSAFMGNETLPRTYGLYRGQCSYDLTFQMPIPTDYWRRDIEYDLEVLEAKAVPVGGPIQNMNDLAALLATADVKTLAATFDKHPDYLVKGKLESGETLASYAILLGDIEKLKLLLARGLKIDPPIKTAYGPVLHAARSTEAMANFVLDQGVTWKPDGLNVTPYNLAVSTTAPNSPLRTLIKRLKPETRELNWAMLNALQYGYLEHVKTLFELGADPKTCYDVDGRGMIGTALTYRGPDFAEKVIKVVGDRKEVSPNGRNMAHVAVLSGSYICVQWAVKHGADPEAKDAAGDTPFDLASRVGHEGDRRLLIAALEGRF